ncbi:ATP-dependent transcriptional regulator, MalT-like, LuxR family [Beutenbergia cavernae DSM 12333]|uniref:ATP-dependent transcriptional regulator, MalT-like, LuxR family n=1 Tax=Beutenbergia cavernae (strain ATCC BAA-8 / DSM 12333 / CCUG 43141 / JCM 11478 / NBRC 16432 / NCIMB 13614 / HKI 0122) TaxID=471853 RepID=C5C0G8_BEUC1|nr:LuxR C-terminal-related transcriptional regulator [Beutenbergia cavernae]ACQ81364.1 ATP-dependent transcriptional regulator, MalT-like, LuxR family [Beutenbergia cavernae DSM 12333]
MVDEGLRVRRTHPGPRLPRVAESYVPRPRVLARLERLAPLVIVRAPRGFGKTSLLSWWLRTTKHTDHDVVWLTLDRHAVTEAEFWELLLAGLRSAGLAEGVGATSARRSVHDAVRSLTRRLVLVMDNFPSVPESLDGDLVDLVQQSDLIHLAVAGHRHRDLERLGVIALDAVLVLSSDLALDADAIGELAAGIGLDLTRAQIDRVAGEVGGWPALVRALLHGIEQRDVVGESFTYVDWRLVDLFVREVLAGVVDESVRSFMARTSVADEFTRELAQELYPDRDVTFLLSRMVEAHLLGVQVIDGVPVYTYPRAVRFAIDRLLAESDPELRQALLGIATRWFADRDDARGALVHAVRARDWDQAVSAVDRHWVQLVAQHPDALSHAIRGMPVDLVASNPKLRVAHEFILPLTHPTDLASTHRAELAGVAPRTESDAVRTRVSTVIALSATGYVDIAQEVAQQWGRAADVSGAAPGDVDHEVPTLLFQWGSTRLAAGDVIGSRYAFSEAFAWAQRMGDALVRRTSAVGLALTHAINGVPLLTHEWLGRVELDEDVEEPVTRAAVVIAEALAGVDMLADEAALLADNLPERSSPDELWALVAFVRGQIIASGGDPGAMLACADACEEGLARAPRGGIAEALLVSTLGEVLVAQGERARFRRILASATDSPILAVAKARLAWQDGDGVKARTIAVDALQRPTITQRSRLELLVLMAVLDLDRDRRASALSYARQALQVAHGTGQRRPFQFVPRAQLATLATELPDLGELLGEPAFEAFGDVMPPAVSAVVLTERERTILGELASTSSVPEIATRLFVSPNTVKTQLRGIYRKLGTHSREETLQRARDAGLLDPSDASV